MHVTKAITILRPPNELYEFWRDFENLPRFMTHLQHVETTGPGRSRWVAAAPGGGTVEWDAEVVTDQPNEMIAWRSIGGESDIANSGAVHFAIAPGDRGTEVRVELDYDPPGGKIGSMFAKLFGEEPAQQIGDDLRRFKQVMEIGEVVRSSGTPDGVGTGVAHQHPAQPLDREPPPPAAP